MPTIARQHQLQTSLLYHVFNRGNAKQPLFHESKDYDYFKGLLVKYMVQHELKIYHWALMSNHYHLCLELPEPERLSAVMAGFQRAYVHYHHRKYQSVGYLFQGRFKSKPIQKERYLLACGRYIEQNPTRAGLVNSPEGYPYSSARCYVDGIADSLTTESPLYIALSPEPERRREVYREFLAQQPSGETERFGGFGRPVGDAEFCARLVRSKGRWLGRRRGRPMKLGGRDQE